MTSLFLGDLGGQVVLDVAHAVHDLVHHHQRSLIRHVEGNLSREAARLGEQVQVPGGKAQRDRLIYIEFDGIRLVAGVLLAEDGAAGADFAGDGELDVLLGGLDFYGLGQVDELFADAGELARGHVADGGEFGFRNAHSLGVDGDQREVELGDLVAAYITK